MFPAQIDTDLFKTELDEEGGEKDGDEPADHQQEQQQQHRQQEAASDVEIDGRKYTFSYYHDIVYDEEDDDDGDGDKSPPLEEHKCPRTGCNAAFLSRDRLAEHSRDCRDDDDGDIKKLFLSPVKCPICDQTFTRASALAEHVDREHRAPPDGENSSDGADVVVFDEDGGNRRFKCRDCGKLYTQKVSLSRHFASKHAAVKPFSCEVCGRGFARASYLKDHRRSAHREDGDYDDEEEKEDKTDGDVKAASPALTCDMCDKKVRGKSRLLQHREWHARQEEKLRNKGKGAGGGGSDKKKQYPCKECPKGGNSNET